MMRSRAEVKNNAKDRLSARYGPSLGAYAAFMGLLWAMSALSCGAAALILTPALTVGYITICTACYKGLPMNVGDLFGPGFARFGRVLGGTLWMQLFTFLWSLLFVVPGIVKAIAYSQTSYILANEPNVKAQDAIRISMRMTQGHKGEIFVWWLSFFGWMLLGGLTCGILTLLWVGPYMNTAFAGLYEELRAEALRSGAVTQAMLDGFERPE